MIVCSMVAMYAISYLNSASTADILWSETRFYMNLMMGSAMAVIMLQFMKHMYSDKKLNAAIYISSGFVFILSLALVRSQATVQDVAYMRGMIPHHSIAILTSENAQIRDRRVHKLAEQIAETQRREIYEMNWLIDDIKKNGIAASDEEADKRTPPAHSLSPNFVQ